MYPKVGKKKSTLSMYQSHKKNSRYVKYVMKTNPERCAGMSAKNVGKINASKEKDNCKKARKDS